MLRPGLQLRTAVASLLIALTGCYSYVPVADGPPSRGTQVRARLSSPADVTLTDLTVNNVVAVDAEVVNSGVDSLLLSAMSLRSESGAEFAAAGETVAIPAHSIESLEARRFSLLRSSAVVVAAGAVATLVFAAIGTLDAGGGGGQPKPAPK